VSSLVENDKEHSTAVLGRNEQQAISRNTHAGDVNILGIPRKCLPVFPDKKSRNGKTTL
jgi:hypothetical protein